MSMTPLGPMHVPPTVSPFLTQKPVETSSISEFFEQRSFRRLVAILGIGTAVALAYSAVRKHLYPTESETNLDLSQHEGDTSIANEENGNETECQEEEVPPPEVTLYQVPRGFFTPAVSPFGLKLETFLRVAKIEHEVEIINSGSSDGTQTPWIRVGDKEIKNSTECIKFLNKHYGIDLAAEATSSRKTAARLVDTLFESRISWGVALWRWVYDGGRSVKNVQALAPTGDWVLSKIKESVVRAANYQGMGKQSEEEVTAIVIQGLIDAAAALGKHKYFLGSAPGEVDCHAFSLLSQMVWNMPGSPFEKAMTEQKTLMDYVIRMRDNYWPDWQELILQNKPAATVLPAKSVTIVTPAPAATLSTKNPSTISANGNSGYSPPQEMLLQSEKSLARATTLSQSNNVGDVASVTPVDPKTSPPPSSGQMTVNPTALVSPSPVHSRPVSAGAMKQGSRSSSVGPHSRSASPMARPPLQNNLPSLLAHETQYAYVPPQLQRPLPPQMQLPSFLQSPLAYSLNIDPPQVNLSGHADTHAQHQQYHNNMRMGSGFMNNNNPLPLPQSQYGYSSPIKPQGSGADQSFYEESLQRAKAAVMRSRTPEQTLNEHRRETQGLTDFWQ